MYDKSSTTQGLEHSAYFNPILGFCAVAEIKSLIVRIPFSTPKHIRRIIAADKWLVPQGSTNNLSNAIPIQITREKKLIMRIFLECGFQGTAITIHLKLWDVPFKGCGT